MDKTLDKIAALGVPALVLIVVMQTTGWVGAAALTTALATLGGPLGMAGGLATLGILGLISRALGEYGVKAIFKGVLTRLKENDGMTIDEIKAKVKGYPLSSALKEELCRYCDTLGSTDTPPN